MTQADPAYEIHHIDQLEALYPSIGAAARRKEVHYLHPVYQDLIKAAPFVILATAGPDGLDCSPRGDPAGFVRILDTQTLLIPDRPGNNRLDSLRNLLIDPRVGLLFLIPGRTETLRVNGRATLSTHPQWLADCQVAGKSPRCVIIIKVDTVFFQCGRAVLRGGLWEKPDPDIAAKTPSAGRILEALTEAEIQAEAYDEALPARQKTTLY